MADREREKKKKRAYLDDFEKDLNGNYQYRGAHYRYAGGYPHSRVLALLWLFCGGGAALTVGAPAPFALTLGALASFSSAPFLSVADPTGGIHHLRRTLAGDQDEPGGPYTPHVTVGLYAGTWPTARIQPRLDAFAAPALPCRVERISLMHYAAPEIGGALTTLASFDLARRRLDWHHRPTGWPDTD